MLLPHPKIVTDWNELDARLAGARSQGRSIVFTNGCYDILHPGHVDLLRRAREQGSLLLLGLNSDDSVRRLEKGADRPLNTFAARAFVAAHLESVDLVTIFDDDTPLALIERVRPDVLIKGGDWPVEAIVGGDGVMARGGRVLSLPLLEGWSTTGLVTRIRDGGMPCPRP